MVSIDEGGEARLVSVLSKVGRYKTKYYPAHKYFGLQLQIVLVLGKTYTRFFAEHHLRTIRQHSGCSEMCWLLVDAHNQRNKMCIE